MRYQHISWQEIIPESIAKVIHPGVLKSLPDGRHRRCRAFAPGLPPGTVRRRMQA